MPSPTKTQEDRVVLRGNSAFELQLESNASGAIYPADILKHTAADEYAASIADAAIGPHYIALENASANDTMPATHADSANAYADEDNLVLLPLEKGKKYTMWLSDGETAVLDSALVTNGSSGTAGTLAVITPDATTVTTSIVAFADEAVDNSVGGAPAKIKVRGA